MKKAVKFLNDFRQSDLFLVLSVVPILFILTVDPNSFGFFWSIWGQQGRGGLLFAVFFLAVDWFDARVSFKLHLTRKAVVFSSLCLVGVVLYFGSVILVPCAFDSLVRFGERLGVTVAASWVALWDYVVYAVYLAGIAASFFGFGSFKKLAVPFVYLSGMGIILFLDAAFPYGSLGILQSVVPVIVAVVAFLLAISGVNVSVVGGKTLLIWGKQGFLPIDIYWPCAGVHSMIIFFLVIALLMMRFSAPLRRKLIYAGLGAVGTFFINIVRIFLVCYYGAFISKDIQLFHETIGETLFLIWVVLFLVAIIRFENWKASRSFQPPMIIGRSERQLPPVEALEVPKSPRTRIFSF